MRWQRDEEHALRAKASAGPAVGETRGPGGGRVRAGRGSHSGSVSAAPREHEGYLIKELQHLLRTQIESRMRAKGLWLSFPHSAVLMTLNEEPGLSGAQLARRCSVTAQTMNGLLHPLEAKGLIERSADPENARVLKCYLKPKGTALLQEGMHEAGAVFEQMLGMLSARERQEFRGILRRCIDALRNGTEDAGTGCAPSVTAGMRPTVKRKSKG